MFLQKKIRRFSYVQRCLLRFGCGSLIKVYKLVCSDSATRKNTVCCFAQKRKKSLAGGGGSKPQLLDPEKLRHYNVLISLDTLVRPINLAAIIFNFRCFFVVLASCFVSVGAR